MVHGSIKRKHPADTFHVNAEHKMHRIIIQSWQARRLEPVMNDVEAPVQFVGAEAQDN